MQRRRKIKRRTKCQTKRKPQHIKKGGSFLDAIGSVVQTRTNIPRQSSSTSASPSTSPLPSFISLLNPDSIEKRLSQRPNQFFQITYNYNSPNAINININGNKPIPSSAVGMEPHIIIGDINRYLIVLVDDAPNNELLWIAEFANNTKQKTILSYHPPLQSPMQSSLQSLPSITMKKHAFAIKIYSYPTTVQPFILNISNSNKNSDTNTNSNTNSNTKKQAYRKFLAYLTNPQNANQIKLIKTFPLNIYNDNPVGVNVFSLLSQKTPKTQIATKPMKQMHNYTKLASRPI